MELEQRGAGPGRAIVGAGPPWGGAWRRRHPHCTSNGLTVEASLPRRWRRLLCYPARSARSRPGARFPGRCLPLQAAAPGLEGERGPRGPAWGGCSRAGLAFLSPACGRGSRASRAGRRCGASAASADAGPSAASGLTPVGRTGATAPEPPELGPGHPGVCGPCLGPPRGRHRATPAHVCAGLWTAEQTYPKTDRRMGLGLGSCCCPSRLASPRRPQPRPGDAPREGTSPFGSVGVSLSRPVSPKPALSPGARFCSLVYLVFCPANTVCHSRTGMFLWRL